MSGSPTAPGTTGTEDAVLGLNAPVLSGIRRLSALDTVRARIALAVDLGLLAPGERLPPTDQIAEALGVGDITVRRALTVLCRDGILERRRGRNGGTLVAEQPALGAVGVTAAYRSQATEVHRLIDRRIVLECGVAHLAARNADEAAVRQLQQLADEMDRVPSWAGFHGCDERFHVAVAAASGVATAVEPYHDVLRELYRYYLPYPMDALRDSNQEHHALAAAIRSRDAATAADIAQRHVDVLHRTMFVGLISPAAERAAAAATGQRSDGASLH